MSQVTFYWMTNNKHTERENSNFHKQCAWVSLLTDETSAGREEECGDKKKSKSHTITNKWRERWVGWWRKFVFQTSTASHHQHQSNTIHCSFATPPTEADSCLNPEFFFTPHCSAQFNRFSPSLPAPIEIHLCAARASYFVCLIRFALCAHFQAC